MALPAPRDTSLRLRSDLAENVEARAALFRLKISGYVALLIHNQDAAPVPLEKVDKLTKTTRVSVPCSFRREIAPVLKRIAASSHLNQNAAVESLIERDLRNPTAPLVLLPRR